MRPILPVTLLAAAALAACQSPGQKQFARDSKVSAPVEAVVQSEPGRQAALEAAEAGASPKEATEAAVPAAEATDTK